jgi:hypothetical protein
MRFRRLSPPNPHSPSSRCAGKVDIVVIPRSCDPAGLIEATLGDVITARDQADLVKFVRAAVATLGSVRVLITLERFVAWDPDALTDSDPSLWLDDDEGVVRIAVVGDPAWRHTILTLVAQSLRRVPIEYFTDDAMARRWLGVFA